MLELIEFLIGSPLGVLIVTLLKYTVYAAIIIANSDEPGFHDLGRLLFGGLIIEVLVGVGSSLLWRRWRERHAQSSANLSIRADQE